MGIHIYLFILTEVFLKQSALNLYYPPCTQNLITKLASNMYHQSCAHYNHYLCGFFQKHLGSHPYRLLHTKQWHMNSCHTNAKGQFLSLGVPSPPCAMEKESLRMKQTCLGGCTSKDPRKTWEKHWGRGSAHRNSREEYTLQVCFTETVHLSKL